MSGLCILLAERTAAVIIFIHSTLSKYYLRMSKGLTNIQVCFFQFELVQAGIVVVAGKSLSHTLSLFMVNRRIIFAHFLSFALGLSPAHSQCIVVYVCALAILHIFLVDG